MDTLTKYTFNKKNYFMARDLRDMKHKSFKHNTQNFKKYLKKYEMKKDLDYVYARFNNKKWELSDGTSTKVDKLFIRCKWAYNYGTNVLSTETKVEEEVETDDETKEEIVDESNEEIDEEETLNLPKNITIYNENITRILPKSIKINSADIFCVDNNKSCIEYYGDNDPNNCYIDIPGVEKTFSIKYVVNKILHKDNKYIRGIDYQYFNVPVNNKNRSTKYKKTMYLTYYGLNRLIFITKGNSDIYIRYREWATNILFADYFGSRKQKCNSSKHNYLSPETVINVFNKAGTNTAVTYVIRIGYVNDETRNFLNIQSYIPDGHIIVKYGRTTNFCDTIKRHLKTYPISKGFNHELLCYNYVDPKFQPVAETDIGALLDSTDYKFKNDKYIELGIIPKNKINKIISIINNLMVKYQNTYSDILNQIESERKDHMIQINDLQMENEQLKNTNNMLKKDIEILELKSQFSERTKKRSKSKKRYVD